MIIRVTVVLNRTVLLTGTGISTTCAVVIVRVKTTAVDRFLKVKILYSLIHYS